MQNTKYHRRKILINGYTVKDFGLYQSTDPNDSTTQMHLLLKKYGLDIPYQSATLTTISKSCTQSGINKSVLLSTNAPAPCTNCNYDFNISIIKKTKDPGVLNDDYYKKGRAYGAQITAIQTPVGGQLQDSDKLYIEDNIIDQIGLDQLTENVTREPSIVHAQRLFFVTVTAAATYALSYTIFDTTNNVYPTAVTGTVTMNSGATILTMVNDLNADATFKLYLLAMAKSATELIITSISPEVKFLLSDGGGGTTIIAFTRYIWLYSKDPKWQFEVQFDYGFMTVQRFNMLILDNTSAAAGNSIIYVGGTASGNIANAATSTTYAANINGSSISALVYAVAKTTTGNVFVYVYTGVREARVTSLGTAGVTINSQYSGNGLYSSLTADDVFRVFLNQKDLGQLSSFARLDQPAAGTKWCKLLIKNTTMIGAIHGASHQDLYVDEVELYILQGQGATNIWYATNYMWESTADGAGFTANATLNALIYAWNGSSYNPALP